MKLGAMNNPRKPLLEQIEWIAGNDFDFIDLALEAPAAALERNDWQSIAQAIQDAGLDVLCHAASYLPVTNPSPLVRQAAMDEIRRSIDAAQMVGAKLCSVTYSGLPDFFTESEGYEFYRQLFAILLKHGAERGVEIALENTIHNMHQLKHLREIFQRLPGLRLLYDIGHNNVGSTRSNTRDYLFAFANRLAHVRLSDNDGRHDSNLPFGAAIQGGIELEKELRELRAFNWDGPITIHVLGDQRWLLASAEMVRAWLRSE